MKEKKKIGKKEKKRKTLGVSLVLDLNLPTVLFKKQIFINQIIGIIFSLQWCQGLWDIYELCMKNGGQQQKTKYFFNR